MLRQLRTQIEQSAPFVALLSSILHSGRESPIVIGGLSGSLLSFVLSSLSSSLKQSILVVTHERAEAEQLLDDINLVHDRSARLFDAGVVQFNSSESSLSSNENTATLRALVESAVDIVVTTSDSFSTRLPEPTLLESRAIRLDVGKDYTMKELLERLRHSGFERRDFVGVPGEYSLRGGILDVFSHGSEYPIRSEFFGDTVESIREFDPLSQRSIREIDNAGIVPQIFNVNTSHGSTQESSLLEYLNNDALVFLIEPELIWKRVDKVTARHPDRNVETRILRDQLVSFVQLHQELLSLSRDMVDFNSSPQPSFNGNVQLLREHLLKLRRSGVGVLIVCDGQAELKRLRELVTEPANLADVTFESLLSEHDLEELRQVKFVHHAVHAGFLLHDQRLACYTEHQIFGRQRRRGARRRPRFRGFSLKELQQLRIGDFVVHQDFGIGRFDGLKKIRIRDIQQEAIKLSYEGKDILYVNLNYLGKVQKYSSKDGHIPKLSRLGTQEWDKLKARAKKRIQDIARDLIRLYAKRKGATGHAFQPDTPWQKELEASFIYEDTFDQAKATLEVKQDMERPFPMDRLVCGDVGFGKTEVAVRAAFKAVLDGKQVAVLVPTTILAIQHLATFVGRASRYPVRVDVISRLKSKREQEQILDQLKAGTMDIIIGTHRILSKDVHFKNLGLLIIDEEHRFGVAAKEKLRQLRTSVDTLTLTATPIPRTLHFSLMGARDLSIMATAPRNRLSIVTETCQYNEALIKDAVEREIGRGGQVYFVHDRVNDIDVWTEKLRALLPSVQMRCAHGQMRAHELEEVMLEFQEKKLDMLVCTKIIESGLDIPNANTIIINRADRFGLSELYQLKGRVGRSNVQAYAYLLVPPITVLPRTTIQRLQAVEEFSELGSGFNLAMRDLEIRGAGNLLGAEQSGFIESMGFETYTRILDDAIRELKEQEFKDLFPYEQQKGRVAVETIVEAELEAFIPSTYVENDTERLEIYGRMYALTSDEQLAELGEELKDRFGPHPTEVQNLLNVVRVRLAAGEIGFRRVLMRTTSVDIEFPPETDTAFYEANHFQTLMTEISNWKGRNVLLKQDDKSLRLTVTPPNSSSPIHAVIRLLKELSGRI
jgi:transcription-repair coupling factor (superfamily II helicase)